MALPDKESNVYRLPMRSLPLPEDECLSKVMESLLKSSYRKTEVFNTSLKVPVTGAICSGRACCVWNKERVMCCVNVKDDKTKHCFVVPNNESRICFKKKGKLYCNLGC